MRAVLLGVVLSGWLSACMGDIAATPRADAGARADAAPSDAASLPRDAAHETSDGRSSGDGAPDARDGLPDARPTEDAAQDAAASTDASDASGAPGCEGKAYRLCEDFETAEPGALPAGWSAVAGWNSGAALVSGDEHHSGARSLKAALAVNGQPRAGRSLSTLGPAAGKHWGRIFYKVKTPVTLPPTLDNPPASVIHNTLVGLKGSTESRVVDTVVNAQGNHQFLYNLPDDSCCTGSSYDYHSYDAQWHCAEWYVDASTQSYRFFFEGSEVKAIGFSNGAQTKARIEQYTSIVLGWINYQTPKTPYYEAWFDDLALDDARIGCQ